MSQSIVEKLPATFERHPPAAAAEIDKVEAYGAISLPSDYVQFLREADGGDGFIGSTYVIIWRLEELLELNSAYEVAEYAPGLLLFGSDGGGEGLAFDMRAGGPVVSVPFVGMDLELAKRVGANFSDFIERLLSA